MSHFSHLPAEKNSPIDFDKAIKTNMNKLNAMQKALQKMLEMLQKKGSQIKNKKEQNE